MEKNKKYVIIYWKILTQRILFKLTIHVPCCHILYVPKSLVPPCQILKVIQIFRNHYYYNKLGFKYESIY